MSRRRPPRRRRRTIVVVAAVLTVAVAAVALVRTGHIGQSQDLSTAWADETPTAPSPDTAVPAAAAPAAPDEAQDVADATRAPDDGAPSGAIDESSDVASTLRTRAYWPSTSGTGLVSADVDVSAVAPLGGALGALGDDRDMPAGAAPVPLAGAIQAVERRGDMAVIDFDATFAAIYPAGSAEEIAALAPIVYTATALAGITGVIITVGGAPPTTSGSFDLNEPLSRASFPGLDR